jgi:hypothetical protein
MRMRMRSRVHGEGRKKEGSVRGEPKQPQPRIISCPLRAVHSLWLCPSLRHSLSSPHFDLLFFDLLANGEDQLDTTRTDMRLLG